MDQPSFASAAADDGPSTRFLHPVHQMNIKDAFEGLTDREKLYAHHMSRFGKTDLTLWVMLTR
jgi:hypothetical protein